MNNPQDVRVEWGTNGVIVRERFGDKGQWLACDYSWLMVVER